MPQVYSKQELFCQAGSRYRTNLGAGVRQTADNKELISARARNSASFTSFEYKNIPTELDYKYGLALTTLLSVIRLHCK